MHDPAASLSLFPVEFTLAGQEFTLPGHAAGRWLEVLLANDLMLITSAGAAGLIDDDQALHVESLLIEGQLDMEELRDCLRDVVTAVAGRDWWEAVGLVHSFATEGNWARMHGQVVAAGLNPETAPFGAWLDLATFLATQHMDEKQLGRFMGILRTPPLEVGLDEEREAQAFLAMLNG